MRMNMDGSGFEVLLSDLHWHEGIAIDYEREYSALRPGPKQALTRDLQETLCS